jgi:hypothetical protein
MLSSILQHIERIYDLDLGVDIDDFVVNTDTCTRLGHDSGRASVLVREDQSHDELELGVYIHPTELDELSKIDLTTSIDPSRFELLVTAIEEVSHFAYLTFCATREKRVTQLELELQAEVDKFITATLLVASNNRGRVQAGFLDRLFGDFELRDELDADARERYAAAASFASRYCSYVIRDSLGRTSLRALLPELRSFYRLTQGGKIGRIHNRVYAA